LDWFGVDNLLSLKDVFFDSFESEIASNRSMVTIVQTNSPVVFDLDHVFL